jgi:23S rRNA (pseudouridine1915-N3)-methyltransferase
MRLITLAIGKLKRGPESDLFEEYQARLKRPGGLGPLELVELEAKTSLPSAQQKAEEAKLLRAQIPRDAKVVALDERGKSVTSEDFARTLGGWRQDGAAAVCFLIGGADGLDADLRKEADLVLAFGAMTWPHRLVRPLLAEQLYRADTIIAGHPYHRR